MVKNINHGFVKYLAGYLKSLLLTKNRTITAEQFQGTVTGAVNEYLKRHHNVDAGGVRSAIAQSTPEAECAKAKIARDIYNPGPDDRISHYKTQAEISKVQAEISKTPLLADITLGIYKYKYELAKRNEHNLVISTDADWESKTIISLPDMRLGKDGNPIPNKKRLETVPFRPESAVYCGKCWICRTDVMSYSGPSIQLYNNDIPDESGVPIQCTTPCGDCEHVSAVMASYIAGMLKSGGFAKFYWASYYIACVECNRKKSNYIGVKLHATRGWEVDDDGVDTILNSIFPEDGSKVTAHGLEYNPIRNALRAK